MSTASNNPSVSTNRWRLRPLIFLPPSYPRSGPPISVVLTDWLSMHAALGVGSPRGLCLAGGISGSTMAHCSSVRSEGYFFRDWSFPHIRAHSSADGTCANYLTNILFCQALFPDSLSHGDCASCTQFP